MQSRVSSLPALLGGFVLVFAVEGCHTCPGPNSLSAPGGGAATANSRWADEAAAVGARRIRECASASPAVPAPKERAVFALTAWSEQEPPPAAVPTGILAADAPAASTSEPSAEEGPATQPAATRGPLPGFGETVKRDVKRMPAELWRDTKRVYTSVPNLVILGLAGAASIATAPEVDDKIEDHYDEHHTFSKGWRDTFGALGNPGIHFAVAGAMYLAGQQLPSDKTYEVGRTAFSALIINDLSTVFLKICAWNRSPNGELWAWPSGHVSSTAALAAVLDHSYGPLVGVPMYGLTTLVAIERLDDREHFFSDVIFGGVMGWVIGHSVATGRSPEIFGGEIMPYADPTTGSAGVAWLKRF